MGWGDSYFQAWGGISPSFYKNYTTYVKVRSVATKTVKRAYKYRFYPTLDQVQELERTWGCVRVVYNKALDLRTRSWYDLHENMSYLDTAKMLTRWRNSEELGFLSEVSVVPLQQSLRHLQQAFNNFWRKKSRYPRFKSRKKSTLSLEYSKSGFRIKDGAVYLAKMKKPLSIAWSRECDLQSVSTITVKRDKAGRWFVSLLCESRVEGKPITGKTVGIDVGVKDVIVLSDGRKLNPDKRAQKKNEERIKRRQRELSRKQKGSKNREKAKLKLSRAYARYTDTKRDWLHKTTTCLVGAYDVLCIEDLNVSGMTRKASGKGRSAKSGLNRSILSNNLSELRSILEYKSDWYGRECVAIDRFYPSSKRCSECGYINQELTLNDKRWVCSECGVHHDRDINAAKNIKAAGLAVLACGDGVRLES